MDDIPIPNLQSKLAFGADHVEEFCLFLKNPWPDKLQLLICLFILN
jgi:hypothetical protein